MNDRRGGYTTEETKQLYPTDYYGVAKCVASSVKSNTYKEPVAEITTELGHIFTLSRE